MMAALYILAGVVATLAFLAASLLLAWVFEGLFGSTYGLIIEMVVLFSLVGGCTGWMIYRTRRNAEPRP
jgi:uncharacterized membrane protein YqjE